MKKLFVGMLSVFFLMSISGNAHAIGIQFGSKGALELSGFSYNFDYSDEWLQNGAKYDPNDGDPLDLNFFKVDLKPLDSDGWYAAFGTATATIDLDQPFDGNLGDDGRFFALGSVSGNIDWELGILRWGAPLTFNWANSAGDSGALTLDMHNLYGINWGAGPITISGTLTHNSGVAPVPEPATLLLLGTGLIGMAGMSRRRFKK